MPAASAGIRLRYSPPTTRELVVFYWVLWHALVGWPPRFALILPVPTPRPQRRGSGCRPQAPAFDSGILHQPPGNWWFFLLGIVACPGGMASQICIDLTGPDAPPAEARVGMPAASAGIRLRYSPPNHQGTGGFLLGIVACPGGMASQICIDLTGPDAPPAEAGVGMPAASAGIRLRYSPPNHQLPGGFLLGIVGYPGGDGFPDLH